jgi:succinate dehydrogenase / fumarate reductase cytochrome b subunit
MNIPARTDIEAHMARLLKRSEKLTYYGASRGWGFLLTWAHRITGLMLVVYMFFHIMTLSGLYNPASFASKMAFVNNFFFTFLEWALAVPVIFHALNGSRLILYEIFGVRNDTALIRWVFVLGVIYVLALGLLMAMGNQHVSAGVFWLTMTIAGSILAVIVFNKLRATRNEMFWKLQRISGAFLLPMVTGHMVFMHLNYKVGHDVDMILARISSMGIKTLDILFVTTVFFHAGFGLTTIIADHVETPLFRKGLTVLNAFVMTIFAVAGVKLVATL